MLLCGRLARLLVLPLLLPLLAAACASDEIGDDTRIVPEHLSVTALAGGNGVLVVTALTLRQGPSGPQLYAALRNDGDTHACSAALSVELFDADDRSLAAGISGLLTQRFHRLTDGTDAIAACVGPGETTMTAIADLPEDLVVDDVATLVYRCPYFALDVAAIEGLSVEHLERVTHDSRTVYTGTVVNGFDVAVARPSVTVFATNRVGRPLGVATASQEEDLAPGARWSFETGFVDAPAPALADATDQLAFPAGALPAPAPTASERR